MVWNTGIKMSACSLESLTLANEDYRKVIYTSDYSQIVAMHLNPNENIPYEVHSHMDQFFYVISGQAMFFVNNKYAIIHAGSAFIVPAGISHTVANPSITEPCKLYTIYSFSDTTSAPH